MLFYSRYVNESRFILLRFKHLITIILVLLKIKC